MVIVGATGAITALGDTLFPSASLTAGIVEEMDTASHFLVRLRVIHPMLAVIVSIYLLLGLQLEWFADDSGRKTARRLILAAFILVQLIAGAINVLLLAPILMQIIHLLIADMVWIAFILYVESHVFTKSAS
jgi:heme A synthase